MDSQLINYDNPYVRSLRRCDETLSKLAMIRTNLELYRRHVEYTLREVKDARKVWPEFQRRIEDSHA